MTQTFWQTSLLHLMSFDVLFYEHVLTQFDLHVVRNIQFVTLFTWLGWLSVGHQATPWGLPAQENRRKVLRCKSTNYNHSLELLSSLRLISGARLALMERVYAIIRYVTTFSNTFCQYKTRNLTIFTVIGEEKSLIGATSSNMVILALAYFWS